jgi:dihydrodipicolinate reductase
LPPGSTWWWARPGFSEADYTEIDAAARAAGRGVIAAGNFSVLAATLLHAASVAAAHIEHGSVRSAFRLGVAGVGG